MLRPARPARRLADRGRASQLRVVRPFAGEPLPDDLDDVRRADRARRLDGCQRRRRLPVPQRHPPAARRRGRPRGPDAGHLPGRPAAGGGHRRPGRAQPGRARVRRAADRQAGQRVDRSAVRPDADHARRDPVARRRDRRPAARRGPAGQLAGHARTRRSGSAGWPGACSSTSRPHRRCCARWADEDAAALADYDVEAILARPRPTRPDVVAVWQPFAQRFAAMVADPSAVQASRSIRISTADPITDPAEIRAALAAELQAATAGRRRRRPLPWPDAGHEPTADRDASPTGRGAHMLARVGFHDGAAAEDALAGPVLGWWDADAARPTDDRGGRRDRRARAQRRTRCRPGRARRGWSRPLARAGWPTS